jgi:hypothetical protein
MTWPSSLLILITVRVWLPFSWPLQRSFEPFKELFPLTPQVLVQAPVASEPLF